jgi:hypothetical protein
MRRLRLWLRSIHLFRGGSCNTFNIRNQGGFMRIPASVSWGLVLASAVVSTILWRQLHTERQLTEDLRNQLLDAQTAFAARPQVQPAVAAAPPPAASPATTTAPAAPPAKAAVQAASAVLMADSAQRQKKLLEDSEFRRARINQVRGNIQLRFPNLAKDLGLSQQEADGLLTLIAEYQLRAEAVMADAMAAGNSPPPALIADLTRAQKEHEQQYKSAMAALIGPERAAAYQDYEETAPSRQRGNNLATMLTQAGKPLTPAQSKSLTALIVAEQRRREDELKTMAASGQPLQQSQADRAIDSDRRVLSAAAGFLDAQQVELVRARFEQVAARTRASASVQQRQMEAVTQQPGAGNDNTPAATTP